MQNIHFGSFADTPSYVLKTASAAVARLVEQAIGATVTPEIARSAVEGDAESLASFGRAIAVQEGHLLEAVIIALASTHPSRVALTDLRLAVLPAAIEVIKRNRKTLYQGISFEAPLQTGATYHPDLVIADPGGRYALIIDVKRSLSGYLGGSKLLELQQRMTASGLVLPDLLWRDHQRLAVETVGTAIIDGSKTSTDVSDGVWPLSRLDDLLQIEGASRLAIESMNAFRAGLRKQWQAAIAEATAKSACPSEGAVAPTKAHPSQQRIAEMPARRRGRPPKARPSIQVGVLGPGLRPH
ncbi:hypothetical protein [Rhizobium glycinendophyticum]|uniref:Restriction endonuclease n=1 Tax=Rhizobium glycinendophyticum TaxID=2589807 RepID=A0A504TQ43_9HYPH|nr:hypothetical protein [Rhizobium glycinendophyticum]TPP04219.1 hypothetical protein FJQ55_22425 [Rhizobium glycinendophyticum]